MLRITQDMFSIEQISNFLNFQPIFHEEPIYTPYGFNFAFGAMNQLGPLAPDSFALSKFEPLLRYVIFVDGYSSEPMPGKAA